MSYFSTHKIKSFFIILLSFFIFIALSQSKAEEIVYVPYTGDVNSFLAQLEREGFVSNGFSKLVLHTILTLRGGIEPGGYSFTKGMGAVSSALALDEPKYKYVSIIEGFRRAQIAEVTGEKLGWSQEEIEKFATLKPMCMTKGQEGFLASGTYLIHTQESADVVQKTMEDSFDEVLRELNIDKDSVSVPEIITIASLIQREAGGKSDMRLISGIIHKRLSIGMALQIDATLQYAKGDAQRWWPVPKSEDKYIDSPFNTYQNKGLPPAPIATPGKEAIKAALNPLKTTCLFYLHDKRGNIHCSTNYEQHKKNVNYYLK